MSGTVVASPAPRSFDRLLREAVAAHADRVAVVDPALGREVTYAGLDRLVAAAAAALPACGAGDGDRVAVLARNGMEQAVAVLACARAGLVHLGLPADAPAGRLAALLDAGRPRLVLAQAGLLGIARDAVSQLPAGQTPTLLGAGEVLLGVSSDSGHGGHGTDGTDGEPRSAGHPVTAGAPAARDDAGRTYALIATSGSTGTAKLVRLTGAMTDLAARAYTEVLGLGVADRTAVHLPMWWVSGHVTQLASALNSGGSVVTMATWSASELLRVVRAHDVTWLDLVPSLWHQLLHEDGFEDRSLPSLRAAVFGGAPASAEVLARVRRRVPGVALHDAYAMSEVPAPMTCLLDADAAAHPGTVGRALPGVEVTVVGPDGLPVGVGAVGAVAARTPALTPGYAGADVLALDEAGRFRTGDLGRLDEAGYLTITGRAADVVIRGGVNIHPVEVEHAFLGSGLVAQALVVGVPSRRHGQAVAALVVRAGPGQVDVAALRRAVTQRLGAHAAPSQVLVVAELPRNGNGKPDRAAARSLLTTSAEAAPEGTPAR